MKRIVHLVFFAVVACGAETALSQESRAPEAKLENAESYVNVAAFGQAAERHAAPEARPVRKLESMLESTGLAGYGPFPSRGGPNDD